MALPAVLLVATAIRGLASPASRWPPACALLVVPWTVAQPGRAWGAIRHQRQPGLQPALAHGSVLEGHSVPPQDLWDERPASRSEREIFFDDEGRSRCAHVRASIPPRGELLAAHRLSGAFRL
jgi:hypothetical protein